MAAHSCGVLKERFAKNAKPASARCRTMGLGCAQQALATQVVFVYTKTLLAKAIVPVRIVNSDHNCYTGLIKNFSGGCYSDCTDNANREQTLPHLR